MLFIKFWIGFFIMNKRILVMIVISLIILKYVDFVLGV